MSKGKDTLRGSLISLGIPEKEAAVYIALLQLGRANVSQIARRANVNRSTAYVLLDSLISQGLARISGKEPKQEYAAESPENLSVLFKSKADAAEEKMRRARALAPELKSIQKLEDRPQVKFYEGLDGLKQVYEDTLTAKEPILAYASVDDMHATLKDYFPRYYERRAKKGIFIWTILPRTELGLERAAHNKEEARETAFVPSETFRFHPEINIYDDKVMIASWREKLGIIIESAEIADAMKKIFKLAWGEAKRLEKSGL